MRYMAQCKHKNLINKTLKFYREYAAQNPTIPKVQDTLYGAQRQRLGLPKTETTKRPVGTITISGERLTARHEVFYTSGLQSWRTPSDPVGRSRE